MSETKNEVNCFIAQDKIIEQHCRATVTTVTSNGQCKKTQCPNKAIREVEIPEESPTNLCDKHATLWNSEVVEIFEIASRPENNYYAQNVRYRNNLMAFVEKYTRLKSIVLERKSSLLATFSKRKERYNEVTEEVTLLSQEIDNLTIEIQTSDTTDSSSEIMRLQNLLSDTSEQRDQLKTTLDALEDEISFLKRQNDTCSVNISSMGEITDRLLKDLHIQVNLQDIPADFAPKEGETETEKDARLALKFEQIKTERKKKLLQDGLFVLVRIRCDEEMTNEMKINGNIQLIPETREIMIQGQNELQRISLLKINETTLEIGAKLTSSLYNDQLLLACKSDTFLQNISIKQQNRQYYEKLQKDIYATHVNETKNKSASDTEYLKNSEFPFNKSISIEKAKIRESVEFRMSETKIPEVPLRSQRRDSIIGRMPVTIAEDPLKQWKDFQSKNSTSISQIATIEFKDPNTNEIKTKKVVDLWKLLTTRLKESKKEELESFKSTLLSGIEFAQNSEISFLAGQDPANLLKAVTIVGIGGSGGGKTTAAKALLQYIINIYRDKYRDFVAASDITISFRQVYESNLNEILVENMNSFETEYTKKYKNVKFPYLRKQPYARDDEEEPKEKLSLEEYQITKDGGIKLHELCTKPDCAKLIGDFKTQTDTNNFDAIQIMKKISELDNDTEKNRRIRYTLNNQSGSSRSIKIIQIKFISSEQTVSLNLIDTAGYENYESDASSKQLLTFYEKLVKYAVEVDEYKKGVHKLVAKWASDMHKEALQEGKFIRNSLDYIEKMLVEYNDMQRTIKSTIPRNHAKSTDIKSRFSDILGAIKPTSGSGIKSDNSWLAEFLPQHSTAIVLGAFKSNMNATEISSAEETLKFIKKLNV